MPVIKRYVLLTYNDCNFEFLPTSIFRQASTFIFYKRLGEETW